MSSRQNRKQTEMMHRDGAQLGCANDVGGAADIETKENVPLVYCRVDAAEREYRI